MARAIEQLKQAMEACELGALSLPDQIDVLMDAGKSVLQEMSTLTPPNEWVSVEDAMPAEDELVLCIVSGKPKPNIILDEAYQLGSWNKEDGWIIDEYLDWEDANVLWWMPLPAPPESRSPEGEEDT